MNIALHEERLQHCVNIYYVPWIDGTVNCEYCYMSMSCQLYTIYEVLNLQCTASNKLRPQIQLQLMFECFNKTFIKRKYNMLAKLVSN